MLPFKGFSLAERCVLVYEVNKNNNNQIGGSKVKNIWESRADITSKCQTSPATGRKKKHREGIFES